MPSLITKLILFLSSFSPLMLVFALLDSWGRGLPTQICIGLAVASWLGLFVIIRVAASLAAVPVRVATATLRDTELLAYVVTYFVPFLTVPADSLRRALALGIFVVLIAIFYVQGEMYHWNPILGLFGYHVMQIETTGGSVINVITKRSTVSSGTELSLKPASNRVYWEFA
jgi:hypothetical protein